MIFLERQLSHRRQLGNYRCLTVKNNLVDFASNDYLGFSRKLSLEDFEQVGATGSRLLTGNHAYVEKLETDIAAFHDAESGLLFNSGYTANLGLISAVAQPEDVILYDAHIHASTRDGIKLSRAMAFPFRHLDLNHLTHRLETVAKSKNVFVCMESIFSCDGSIAPLKQLCKICEEHRAHLILDEAHATGIMGHLGKGLAYDQNCTRSVFARIHTFSKALGTCGAIVLGSRLLKEYLINFCRPFIYTTALPLPILQSIEKAYHQLGDSECLRTNLKERINLFKIHCKHSPLLHLSNTPIQAFMLGNDAVKIKSSQLEVAGLDVRPLLSPTVQRSNECLRICLHAFNTPEQILTLCRVLCEES